MDVRPPLRVLVTLGWFLFWPAFWMYHVFSGESETAVTLVLLVVALIAARFRTGWLLPLRQAFARLARRKRLAVIAAGLAPLLVRAALLPIFPVPVPLIQDEASYLLGADTFASGRIANPSHPMWIHLESVHVNHTPTYASKYPPAQAMAMAVGQVLGHPWIGVWLSTAIMCAAICWMLQGWLPPQWALMGALLAAARLGVNSYWMNSYWGGAVAAIGGALVFGCYPRLRKELRLATSLTLAIGLVILANSRPYEGLITSLPIAVAVAVWFWRDYRLKPMVWLRRFAFPVLFLLLLGGLAMAYYNLRTTGDPAQFPYSLNHKTYSVGPLFFWQEAHSPPEYRHDLHRGLFVDYANSLLEKTSDLGTFVPHRILQHMEQWTFYLGPLFTLPLITLPWLITDRRIRLPVISLCLLMFFVSLTISFQAHYWAPVTCVIWLVIVQSMRHLRTARWGRIPIGRSIVALIPVAVVFMLIWCQIERAQATPWNTVYNYKVRCKMPESIHPMYQREVVKQKLEQTTGRHLVIVHYTSEHDDVFDWVFNGADIDASKVVWAYDMGAERNEELIEYFRDRTVWLAEPDVEPHRLTPYSPEALPGSN